MNTQYLDYFTNADQAIRSGSVYFTGRLEISLTRERVVITLSTYPTLQNISISAFHFEGEIK